MTGTDGARPALAILVLVLLTTSAAAPAAPSQETDRAEVQITATDETIRVVADGYEAVVDRPYGNLAEVVNAAGHRLVGTNGSMVQGVTVRSGDARQQDDGGIAEPTIDVEGRQVVVTHERFETTYIFGPAQIEVRVEATGPEPIAVDAGSPVEPSRDASRRLTPEPYDRIGAYPTDFATDRSDGQFAIWPTATSTVGNAHTYRPYMLEPVLEGRCVWYTTKGMVRFGRATAHDVSTPGYAERCYVGNQTDVEAEGQVVRDATHQVMQTMGPLHGGDTVAFTLTVDERGYDHHEVRYPVSTRVEDGSRNTTAKLLVPWDKPDDGYRLIVFHPGHWDDKYRHSYLWDFMANHGFIVATPYTTADMGEVHDRHDWGYFEQIEFTELRRWVTDRYDVDRDRVHSVGASLGGLNGLLDTINHPDAYASTVWYDGLYDFDRFWLGAPFGAASTATGIEIGACCGTPPLDDAERYAWDIRDPKKRIDQFQGDLLVVHGGGDWVVPPDHGIELHRAVPGSTLKVAKGTHDDNVFAGYRKAARDQMLHAERSDIQRDRYDAIVYGRPEIVPDGYEKMPEPINWSTSWLRVWAPDGGFVHVQAERRPDGVTITADRAVRVAVEVPEDCAAPCEVRVGGETVEIVDAGWFDSGRAAVLEVAPEATERVGFLEGALDAGPSDTSGGIVPLPGSAAVVALAAAWLVRRRLAGR